MLVRTDGYDKLIKHRWDLHTLVFVLHTQYTLG